MFKLIDSNRYYLPNSKRQWLHLATIQKDLREYLCFASLSPQRIYIEEITGGQLEFIADDKLAEALHEFLIDKGILDLNKPLIPDREWYTMGKK